MTYTRGHGSKSHTADMADSLYVLAKVVGAISTHYIELATTKKVSVLEISLLQTRCSAALHSHTRTSMDVASTGETRLVLPSLECRDCRPYQPSDYTLNVYFYAHTDDVPHYARIQIIHICGQSVRGVRETIVYPYPTHRLTHTHTHMHTHTHTQDKYCNPSAHVCQGLIRQTVVFHNN